MDLDDLLALSEAPTTAKRAPALGSDEALVTIKVAAALPQRRLIGWAYVTHKADGSLAFDSGGTTTDGDGNVVDQTDQDCVDTKEAQDALENAFYAFISSGEGSADDMHTHFGVAKVEGGIFVTPAIASALGVPDGVLPTGALCVIRIPETPRGDALWSDVVTGKKLALSVVVAIRREAIEE